MTTSTLDPDGTAAHTGVRSEDDHVPSVAVVRVGVFALLIFFLGSLAAVSYLRHVQKEAGPAVISEVTGQSKIGLVEQQQFGLVRRGEQAVKEERRRLGSYGWADKKAGVAHIPIEEAMRKVEEGERPPLESP